MGQAKRLVMSSFLEADFHDKIRNKIPLPYTSHLALEHWHILEDLTTTSYQLNHPNITCFMLNQFIS